MTVPRWLRALAAFALALALANAGLLIWLFPRPVSGPGVLEVASAWREGNRVGREVTHGQGARAVLGRESGLPGTTVVAERIVAEGRVVTLHRRLFGLSFVAGRDGLRATLDGRDAFLTPDDLIAANLYRRVGIDVEGALERAAQELGSTKQVLWARGRFRRFTVTRVVSASPDGTGATRDAESGDAPTGARLTLAIRAAARFLAHRVSEAGTFTTAPASAAGVEPGYDGEARREAVPGYDWEAHGEAVRFLAEVGGHFDDLEVTLAAQHAGWALRNAAAARCGAEACVGEGVRIGTGPTASALLAVTALGVVRVGAPFRDLIPVLAAFLRAQQRADGGFAASYDRGARSPGHDERAGVDATAVLALARAHRVARDPANLTAALRGLQHLVGRPGLVVFRDSSTTEPRVCEAAAEVAAQVANPAALELCLDWGASIAKPELDTRSLVPEFGGGFRSGLGWTPDLPQTAARTEAAIATLAIALRDGRRYRSLVPLGARVTAALALLLREQLPGPRPYLLAEPGAVAGGFGSTSLDGFARTGATAAAGSAMLRYLRLLEARGLPSPARPDRK